MQTAIQPSWRKIGEVASNFDCEWNNEVGEQLEANPNALYAQYSGWNFCGDVWHDGEQFNCEVWIYGAPREVITAPDGRTLMQRVSSKYGGA